MLHYLTQSGADPALCVDEKVVAGFTASDFETFVEGLERGDVAPGRWTACARKLVVGLHGEVRDAAVAELIKRFAVSLDTPDLATQRLLVLDALAVALDARPSASRVSGEAIAQIGQALTERELGSQARVLTAHVHEGLEMSRGRYHGVPVTERALATYSDAGVLQRLARLLPVPAERRAARTRLVDLAIAASPSSHVRTHAEQTRTRVLGTGRNALDLSTSVITRTSYTAAVSPEAAVAEQNVDAQSVRLLLRSKDQSALLPAIDLRKILRVDVKGVDSPITLCGPADALDVMPCIENAMVEVGSPVAVLDGEGGLHMRDNLTSSELGRLLAQGSQLTVPVMLGATRLAEFRWPLRVLPPEPVLYTSGEPLSATVERLGSRIAVTFTVPGSESSLAFVEASEADAFSITTRGLKGMSGSAGSRGSTGVSGSSGSSARCPSTPGRNGGDGGHGGNGGNGGDGAPGGPGGDVDITLVCSADCAELERLARMLVRSEGGPGGAAGAGGKGGGGGPGGFGGSGTWCQASSSGSFPGAHLSSGSHGRDGMAGSSGADGHPGTRGRPGHVAARVRPH